MKLEIVQVEEFEMQAVKVGNQRIVLDNVTNVETRMSSFVYKHDDGSYSENFYAKKEETITGQIVTVYFPSMNDTPDYVRFYMTEGDEFLSKFDALLAVQ